MTHGLFDCNLLVHPSFVEHGSRRCFLSGRGLSLGMSLGFAALFTAQVHTSVLLDTTSRFAFGDRAMTDAVEGRFSGAEESPTKQSGAASTDVASPGPAPSESSSSAGSSPSVLDKQSDLLQKIKDLVDT